MAIVSTGSLSLKDLNDAKQLSMFIGASQSKQVIFDGVSTYTPDYSVGGSNQVLTPQLRIAGGGSDISSQASATRWYYQTGGAGTVTQITSNGGGYTLSSASTQPVTLTISSNVLVSQTSMNYICEMDYTDPDTGFLVTSKADIQLVKVINGTNTITAVLSNEAVTLGADASGTVSSYANAGTDIFVYDGSTPLTYDGVGTANGKFKVAVSASGITMSSTLTGSGTTKATTATPSAMTADSASVTYTITGKTQAGASISVTKVQNFSKSKTGGVGNDATTYWLVMANTLQKSASGVYSSNSFVVKAMSQTGTGNPSAYNGYIDIQTSVKGDFTDSITAVGNTTVLSSGSYTWGTVTANIKAFRVRLYKGTGGANQVDEQTCYIVQDGTNSVYVNAWTPNGNAIRNSNGSVLVQTDVYDGVTSTSGSAYKWYLQDATATTSSGGDADGGNGWRLITTIANPTTSPTQSAVTQASTLTAGTYYIKYTWYGLTGETIGNTTQVTQAITAGQALKVVVPTFPAGVVGANVYVGTVTGDANLYYQGNITVSAGNLIISAPITTSTSKLPTVTTADSTKYQLTILPFGINGMAGVKCVVTYNSIKYSNATTVQDLSDPVQVVLTGIDTFKNGIGTTQIKAVCYQAGVEVDPTGTIYTYSWALYDANNALITPVKSKLNTGKTVTVDGDDFVGRANLICTVSK